MHRPSPLLPAALRAINDMRDIERVTISEDGIRVETAAGVRPVDTMNGPRPRNRHERRAVEARTRNLKRGRP